MAQPAKLPQCLSGYIVLAFVSKGFSNWKDANGKFAIHASSKCHKEAILKMVTLPSTKRDVAESLLTQHQREKLERRKCFLKVLSNIKFLARQGLPLRGHGDESDSNFLQLLKLQGEDDARIASWLEKKTDKYTAPDMQNEILKVMALEVLRQVVSSLHTAIFLTIMVNETTDISNKEQVIICFRWVDSKLKAHEEFIGLHQVESTQATALLAVIHDVLLRLNVSITKLRGQCYDGASSMSGSRGGVVTLISEEEPRAVYTHCYGHALNPACCDAVEGCKSMRDALDTSYEMSRSSLVGMRYFSDLRSRYLKCPQVFESFAPQDGLLVHRLYRASLLTTKSSTCFGRSR